MAPDDGKRFVEVHPANWRTVQVYLACAWSRQPVLAGTKLFWIYEGIAAAEIAAAMDGFNVPAKARERVFKGVRIMVGAAKPLLNQA